MISEINVTNKLEYRKQNVIPVFIQYKNECFTIVNTAKDIINAWAVAQKIFCYKVYQEHSEYIDSLLDKELFVKDGKGILIFSRASRTLNSNSKDKNKAIKFDYNAYVKMLKPYGNLSVVKKIINDCELKDVKIYVTLEEDVDSPEFKKELNKIKTKYQRSKKKYQVKKGNFVVGHINGLVLNDEEKFIKYVYDQFKAKTLLGDIVLSESQEEILHNYMKDELNRFNKNPQEYQPEHNKLFALGLVRYAMKCNNAHGRGEFWPNFKKEYGVSISTPNQKYINDIFSKIMKDNTKIYSDDFSFKIDNITMHSFVCDHSANQLFDYLFDFYRIDLERNINNLKDVEKEKEFDALINAIKLGANGVMHHTSCLLEFKETKRTFKNRIRRILKLIDGAFWSDEQINETGNRINHLLNVWISEPKGRFNKEKNYVKESKTGTKGEVLYHSPVLSINNDTLTLILPKQRLITETPESQITWEIYINDSSDPIVINCDDYFKQDKIGCYLEKIMYPIGTNNILSSFQIILKSSYKELKKYKMEESNIRLFDSQGKNINYKNNIVPEGEICIYSNSLSYPQIIGESLTLTPFVDNLYRTYANVSMGQIISLDNNVGIQVGQKLTEGLSESYPVKGASLVNNNLNYNIYNKLPKLIIKAEETTLAGISLVINGRQNRIADHKYLEFKLLDELKTNGYMIDLEDYILSDGLYNIQLVYPKNHKQISVGDICYIKDFAYEFIGAPYVFSDIAKIKFGSNININHNISSRDGYWQSNNVCSIFTFNFSDRNQNSESYCSLVEGNKIKFELKLNNNIYNIYFDIPAFFYKFSLNSEWESMKPSDINIKNFKNKYSRLYVTGPFNFSKCVITSLNASLADEESEINVSSGENAYYDLSRIYYWFKDRTKQKEEVYINLNNKQYSLFNVICKSKLNNVNLIADFDNFTLDGVLDIEGDENYTVTIYKDNIKLCEDLQVVDKKFSLTCDIDTSFYDIYVYEIEEDENGDFDVSTISIPLNNEPIRKKLINLSKLGNTKIKLLGYQDSKAKYSKKLYGRNYVLYGFKYLTYADFTLEEPDSELYGIYNDDIDITDSDIMNNFVYYRARLAIDYNLGYQNIINVLIMFLDKNDPNSIVILTKDDGGVDYGCLFVKKDEQQIYPNAHYKKLDAKGKKEFMSVFNDEYKHLIEIED